MPEELKQKLEELQKAAKAFGISCVVCLASYPKRGGPDETHFSTCVSLVGNQFSDVSEDHVLLDAFREITAEWSKAVH